MARLIDLSHEIVHGMLTYKGLPGPVISDHLSREASRGSYAPGTEFHIGAIQMVGNTGTYLDTPYHRYADGYDLAGLPLDAVAGVPAIVVRPSTTRIDADAFHSIHTAGHAVLIHTGWDRHWGTDAYLEGGPFLTEAAATYLAGAGTTVVGIDSHNIDDAVPGGSRPVHSTLLAAGIPIVEHLCNLESVPDSGGHFFAVPPPVRGFGSFPVRAFVSVAE